MKEEVKKVYHYIKDILKTEVVLTWSNVMQYYGLMSEDNTPSDIDLVISNPDNQAIIILEAMQIAGGRALINNENTDDNTPAMHYDEECSLYKIMFNGVKVDVFIVKELGKTVTIEGIPCFTPGHIVQMKAVYRRKKDTKQIMGFASTIISYLILK